MGIGLLAESYLSTKCWELQPWQDDLDAGRYVTAFENAKFYGAAAMTFHTRSAFNLQTYSLTDKLGTDENGQPDVFDGVRDYVDAVNWSACDFDLDHVTQSVSSSGGSFSVDLSTRWACSWNAYVESGSGVTFPTSHGQDDATVSFTVAANTSGARTIKLRIGTILFTVTQAGI